MSIADTVFQKLCALSPEDQQKVLKFVETLEKPSVERKDPRGMFADRHLDISLADFLEARREAWANFPRDFPEPTNP